jgi:hypothetical protein
MRMSFGKSETYVNEWQAKKQPSTATDVCALSLALSLTHTHLHTHTGIQILRYNAVMGRWFPTGTREKEWVCHETLDQLLAAI